MGGKGKRAVASARRKLTLSIEGSLVKRMKIAAVEQGEQLSTLTEALYRDFLEPTTTGKRS